MLVCMGRLVGCSARRSAVVGLSLAQLPPWQPGVRLGELRVGAPAGAFDRCGPALLCVDLLVKRLAADKRLVALLYCIIPGQLLHSEMGSPLPRTIHQDLLA